ncbi:MAG TPA: hypothetical protein VGX25_16730 [Actinophytocola sp.]|uniref:hypothetical protein n=1 Tax=Actinophytocola sp. TaxID=1872138 RepID=UPI002DDD1A71|nr:hypothetical protein [Actinophytocola sp.]HEV2781030.1 hypothetical protein [Actinophytocola sp.]
MTDHCRGTLVVHALPDAECTDPNCVDCEAPDHTLVIHCTDVDGGCPVCAPPRLHSFAA